jgi:chorismate synthase
MVVFFCRVICLMGIKKFMASNSFGTIFRILTWGESHGKAMGVVIDGCPAGLEIHEEEIQRELNKRAPGKTTYTSPRKEEDRVEIYSGVFEGKTTGAPISLIIPNRDADSSQYDSIKHLLRPGHANYTYLEKYGVFDYRGGGRASARETVCRVAAGAVAKKFLALHGIRLFAYIQEIGGIVAQVDEDALSEASERIWENPLFCPDEEAAKRMMDAIDQARASEDSLGGVVALCIPSLPPGLGDPVYEKLDARLASAFMSLPATKGVEVGRGFQAARSTGSSCNDLFVLEKNCVRTATNHAGGILAGISTGMPLTARIAFKPPSTLMRSQPTLDLEKQLALLEMPRGSRHDPCVAIRAVPVVEAMAALVIADALLCHRNSRL